MTRDEAFKVINDTQEYYVDELVKRILDPSKLLLKEDNFTSDTGTGKTRMMELLANKLPQYFFVVTTLSKGQLSTQISDNLADIENIKVYGLSQFTENSKLKKDDILNELFALSNNRKIIWLRDEGHIHTNKWAKVLTNVCFKIINISATNKVEGLRTNFIHTLMLRTVHQSEGTPEDAIKKLIDIKEQHKKVRNYNPCGIFRSLDSNLTNMIIALCKKYNLKYINLTNNDTYDMSELCKDYNDYDVIINKFKIVEGIDLRRAHVLYMTNVPSNYATTIQVIGRCRRNALLYADPNEIGVDIFDSKNEELLEQTMQCYVFNNNIKAEVPVDNNGNLVLSFCDKISIQQLRPGIKFTLKEGKMINGIRIIEADSDSSGRFLAYVDKDTGFNVLKSLMDDKDIQFYKEIKVSCNEDNEILNVNAFPIDKNGWLYYSGDYRHCTVSKHDMIQSKLVKRKVHNIWSDVWKEIRCYDMININDEHVFVPVDDSSISKISYYPYEKIYNDKEQAIIGVDTFKFFKDTDEWCEERAVTSKISSHTKLQSFICNKYERELEEAKKQCFSGKNIFDFTDNKLNSCLGYCVEYYSKYLVYGEEYLRPHLSKAFKDAHTNKINDGIIVRACLLKYRQNMITCFGKPMQKIIKTISMDELVCENLKPFISAVVQLGCKTAEFVKTELKITNQLKCGDKIYDPNLSTKHISALADYINYDTIIDIKTTNNITIDYVKQVLAYHYLSTKRTDLDIKKVIVFDAVTGRCVRINIK